MHEPERKKEEKTWFNYLFDSCCACCAWRAGSILPVYEETAAAGYRAYTDDGDGKLVAKDMDAGYPETPKEVIKLFGRINQCIYNKKLSDDDFSTLVGKLRVLYCESLQKKNSQDKMESEISAEKKKYPPKKRKIINYSIEDENKFQHKTIDGTEMVYLKFPISFVQTMIIIR